MEKKIDLITKIKSKNFKNNPFLLKDVRTIKTNEVLKLTKNVKPDVIIGGPPCQGFSIMGDKNSSDPRNELFKSYVTLIKDLHPKCFVFENVKGLSTMYRGQFLEELINDFAACGYDIHFKIINAFDYGVPPHAGCGIGLERLMMALTGTENIRDVTFYPRDVDRLTP